MNATFKVICICLSLFVLAGCATTPPSEPKLTIDQAIWSGTTKDKVYNACLAAVAMGGFAVHPLGTNKESGLIVTKPENFSYNSNDDIECHYTLQVLVTETQDNKVMVNVNAVDKNYDYKGYDPGKNTMKDYFKDRVADDFEKFFAQLDNLLGKAEYYRQK
jgi:hypothetical protein